MSTSIHRRLFLKQGGAAALSVALLPGFTGKVAASDRLRVAIVGVGNMGNNHLKWFAALPEVEVVALCDVDENHLGTSLKSLEKLQPDYKAQGYSDFRRVLIGKTVDGWRMKRKAQPPILNGFVNQPTLYIEANTSCSEALIERGVIEFVGGIVSCISLYKLAFFFQPDDWHTKCTANQ